MDFKILFIAPHDAVDILNDNIDVNLILSTGEVYFAVLFTIMNIQTLLKESKEGFIYSTDMIIVNDLSMQTIRSVFNNILQSKIIENCMIKIGYIKDVLPNVVSYEEINDFGSPKYGIRQLPKP